MKTKLIEATCQELNYGKFMLARMESIEWSRPAEIMPGLASYSLLRSIGWSPERLLVFDLQTCEGACFLPGGHAKADLENHRIWVCPMFEPFLEWVYRNVPDQFFDIETLPNIIELGESALKHCAFRGRRRLGPGVSFAEHYFRQEVIEFLKAPGDDFNEVIQRHGDIARDLGLDYERIVFETGMKAEIEHVMSLLKLKTAQ